MEKPVIGIVTGFEYVPKGLFKKGVLDVNLDYVEMFKNKVIQIFIPYTNELGEIPEIVKGIDGLVLIGGEDMDTRCYKEEKTGSKKDMFEMEIYRWARKMHKPILGICRGMQVMNVAEGGTLKDISDSTIRHMIDEDGWVNHHEMLIEDKTLLKKLIGEKKYAVSSVHHQCIEKMGSDLIVSGKAEDGVIEAIESKDGLVIGFQGHIEKCIDNFNRYNKVIEYFIEEAKNGKRKN